jgi:hypothetical protein
MISIILSKKEIFSFLFLALRRAIYLVNLFHSKQEVRRTRVCVCILLVSLLLPGRPVTETAQCRNASPNDIDLFI